MSENETFLKVGGLILNFSLKSMDNSSLILLWSVAYVYLLRQFSLFLIASACFPVFPLFIKIFLIYEY